MVAAGEAERLMSCKGILNRTHSIGRLVGGHLPKANAAADTFRALATSDLAETLTNCASGRELIAIGYADDVETAAQLDSSTVVPLLRQGAFISG